MSSKKSHAQRRKVPTINIGAVVGHRYFPFGTDDGEDTEPKPGYTYQRLGDIAYSVLRPYEVNALVSQARKGEWFSLPYVLHFTEHWLGEFAEILARGGFRVAETDGLLLAALYHTAAENATIASLIVLSLLLEKKCTNDDALRFGAESLADGIHGETYEAWETVVQRAQNEAVMAFANDLEASLPSKVDCSPRVKI